MSKFVMAMDQGTTSSRCILFNHDGEPVSVAQKEFRQIYPHPGWVEHDGMEIWGSQIGVAQEALNQIGASYGDIEAIGIANQRETTLVWDKGTGKPIHNAIVWQCRRTAGECDRLKAEGWEETFRKKTGLFIDAYFSATKLKWLLDTIPGARERAKGGELLFGTMDTWLIWNLTRGKVHATDYSNAARTLLYNIHELRWDHEILDLLDIPDCMLPEVKPSSKIFGHTDPQVFGEGIPIAAAAGDQQAALFGQVCFQPGMAKNTYGTGGFLLMNTGEKTVESATGLLTTIAWGIDNKVIYALEGAIFVAGAAIQWLRDELKIIENSSDSHAMAMAVPDTGGVYFVPAFVGLGAPHWDPYARGTIVGLTRGSGRNQIVRATLEAMAYQTFDVLQSMETDSGIRLALLKVDGGAANNDFLMQFQADMTGTPVERPATTEITALGAAYLAGLATGYWDSMEEIQKIAKNQKRFLPQMDEKTKKGLYEGWKRAVRCALYWSNDTSADGLLPSGKME
jgi:glycerol kinase